MSGLTEGRVSLADRSDKRVTREGRQDKIEIAQVVLKLVFIYKIENKIQFHQLGTIN